MKIKWLAFLIIFCLLFLTIKKDVKAVHQGSALKFNGTGTGQLDRVRIPINGQNGVSRAADVGGDFTIEWWMRANIPDNGGQGTCGTNDGWITSNIIVDRDIYGGGDYGDFGIGIGGGRLIFGVSQGGGGTTACGSTIIADGNWHHIAVTRRSSDGRMQIFVDGSLDGQTNGPTGDVSYRDNRSGFTWDSYLVLAAEKHDAGSAYPSYNGWMDEFRVSNTVRFAGNFERPSQPFVRDGNTMLLYHFNEGSGTGTIIQDDSGNGISGDLRSGAQWGSSTVPFAEAGSTPTPRPTPPAATVGPTPRPTPRPSNLVQPTPATSYRPPLKLILNNWFLFEGESIVDIKVNSLDFARVILGGRPTGGSYFTVSVADERFCMYSTHPATIQLANENYLGQNSNFPIGPTLGGSGGFNFGYGGQPGNKYDRFWSWHFDPAQVRMTETSIEICDGLPSHVEYGPLDTGNYCPWNGKVVALGCQ